jgi:hypothetical protein
MLSKKDKPAVRRSKLPGTPVPLPTPSRPKRVPGQPVPVPIPNGESNYGKGRGLQPRKPAGPKKSGSTSKSKVKITGTASTKPQVSSSMIKSRPKTTSKPNPVVKTIKRVLIDPSSFIVKPKNKSTRAPKPLLPMKPKRSPARRKMI